MHYILRHNKILDINILPSFMSSFVKAKLKGARDALGKKEYEAAREAATQILEYEPENYNACVTVKYKFSS